MWNRIKSAEHLKPFNCANKLAQSRLDILSKYSFTNMYLTYVYGPSGIMVFNRQLSGRLGFNPLLSHATD